MNSEATIYVVGSGMGGELDSWWVDAQEASARANKLNKGANMTLAWSVIEVAKGEGTDLEELKPNKMKAWGSAMTEQVDTP